MPYESYRARPEAAHHIILEDRERLTVSGGVNSPYIWARTPDGMGSWEFFDLLLTRANVVTTPGAGFGPSGEGYIRVTSFGGADATRQAVERVAGLLKNRI